VTRPLKDRPHGEYLTYTNGKCRCSPCRAANTAYNKEMRAKRREQVLEPDDPRHGKNSTYVEYACRCPLCRQAHSDLRKGQSRMKGESL
jgi:Zn finger protein HypA/HybF involved in hydrogenase expression